MLESKMKWSFDSLEPVDEAQTIITHLLEKRGVTTDKQQAAFLSPTIDELIDPSCLANIEKVKGRILDAIEAGEPIMILGDYDADGVTSTVVMMETLTELGAVCDCYIPNRFTEGYGPNPDAMRKIKADGFSLVITVDTGIAAFDSVEVANDIGLDVIITDHHEVQEVLPEAYAVIHPKVSDDYAFKVLAGVGVAFKLSQYLLGYFPEQFLDLVAIGTVSDLVPLIGENRVLTTLGLKKLKQTTRTGLIALKHVAGIKDDVDEEDIGFGIGPRLNAVGRLGSALPAVELLMATDPVEANQLAENINNINQERQEIVKTIAAEAIELVENNPEEHARVIVVAKEGWNEGVLGIVASRLVRTYNRPVLCLAIKPGQGIAKGSARSIEAFNLFEHGMSVRDLFIHFGGHSQAAGMTVDLTKLTELRIALNRIAEQTLKAEDYKEHKQIDLAVDVSQLTLDLISTLKRLAPFGMANPKPLFYVTGVPKDIRKIGADQTHLKFSLEQNQFQVNVIGFGFGQNYYHLNQDQMVEVIGYLSVNEWNNMRSVQLMLEDRRILNQQVFDFRGRKFWYKDVLPHVGDDTLMVHFNQPITVGEKQSEPSAKWINQSQTVKNLIVTDLPESLDEFLTLIKQTLPENIYLCYQGDEATLQVLPSRDDFKWLYAFIIKQGQFYIERDSTRVAKHKGWKINKIKFMIQVFSELEFVKITNGVLTPNPSVDKRPLETAKHYQRQQSKIEMESILYYSSYQGLVSWILAGLESTGSLEEEKVNGL
ncbi:single-stranded-DNA-specific exonuclease [Halolactibacillus halophilus]|uniref:Single-stranded-DNA-specific exonuclease RecJ n=1 Tax=Halolactibacillus halophilus TaxID=306540 RepID=A0A1I5KZS2_9BACI|nr:single-stranded-DNA-specific exonuclease RecJ [Halolactibacillus halophilus]GEM00563.1 single-stranded-DNA-specific exonuclease RecJ [Halolactibacillus halophilus]SFO90106.1 single-stranded-DNA-specific exonuclease [Halolactibacillus halophilus]